MGYARYEITRSDGVAIEAGYAVEALCDWPGCPETVSRGMDALCGLTPGGDEFGCGKWFCNEHLVMAPDGAGYRCPGCRTKGADPLAHSEDAMVATFGDGAPS
ncbi:hypothetical protein [Streptomyces sp. Ac-502]|uniref:hypothetical protein n=1 Tax=Streptomyces sp. Ac-502 TaxID=3342801 RepID=UPI0038627D2E